MTTTRPALAGHLFFSSALDSRAEPVCFPASSATFAAAGERYSATSRSYMCGTLALVVRTFPRFQL